MRAAQPNASRTVVKPGKGTLEVFALDTTESALLALLTDIFQYHWRVVQFGSLIEGAAREIVAPNSPRKLTMLNGYLTVDFGAWHFHICIGRIAAAPPPPVLAAHRRTARAELYRQLSDKGAPNSWGLRLLNGHDEQQFTVFLPNSFLSDNLRPSQQPAWSRLALWEHLCKTIRGLAPDPKDRTGAGFRPRLKLWAPTNHEAGFGS